MKSTANSLSKFLAVFLVSTLVTLAGCSDKYPWSGGQSSASGGAGASTGTAQQSASETKASTRLPGTQVAGLPAGIQPDPVLSQPRLSDARTGATRVALLAPLTGRHRELGEGLKRAAQMALFDFGNENFEFTVHDTEGTPQGAATAAAQAVNEGAQLIIGPLLASSVEAVAPVAGQANVNVIAFSSDRAVAGNGVYTMGFLPGDEVQRVLNYAQRQGLQSFAVLAPLTAYGDRVVEAAEQVAINTGMELVEVHRYDPGAQDYSPVIRELAHYEERRRALLEERAKLKNRKDPAARRALERLEEMETVGPVPYEALLVGEGGQRLIQLAALIGHFDIDPNQVRILGTGQLDVEGLGAEPVLNGAWYAAPERKSRQWFVDQYKKTYGEEPPRLATLAYDAVALAATLGRSQQFGERFSQNALTNPSGFKGRDGIFRFLPEGTTERGLAVVQVRRRDTRVLSEAPESF